MQSKYMPAAWGGNPYTELKVPTGGVCLVRKLQPIDLAGGDALGATDLLADIVQERIQKAKGTPQDHRKPEAEQRRENEAKILDKISGAISSPENLDSLVDTVVIKAVVEPQILRAPADMVDRVDGAVYVDTVPFADKMAIFDWVMKGLDGLKGFRKPTDRDVAGVEASDGVPHPAE